MVRKVIFGLKPNSCDVTSQSVSAGCLNLSTPLISLTSRNQKFIQGTQSNLTLSAKPRSSNACWISAIIFPAKSVGKVTLKSIPILNSEPDLSFGRTFVPSWFQTYGGSVPDNLIVRVPFSSMPGPTVPKVLTFSPNSSSDTLAGTGSGLILPFTSTFWAFALSLVIRFFWKIRQGLCNPS